MILKAAHTFNLLDARGAVSVTERAGYIGRIRTLSRLVAQAYVEAREALGFPMLPPTRSARRRDGAFRNTAGRAAHRGTASEIAEAARRSVCPAALPPVCASAISSTADSVVTVFATPRRLAVSIAEVLAVAPDDEAFKKLMPAKVHAMRRVDVAGQADGGAARQARAHIATDSLDATMAPTQLHVAIRRQGRLRVSAPMSPRAVPLVSGAAGRTRRHDRQTAHRQGDELRRRRRVLQQPEVRASGTRPGRVARRRSRRTCVRSALTRAAGPPGHRFLGRPDLDIATADAYEPTLEAEGKVIRRLRQAPRRRSSPRSSTRRNTRR